MAIINSRYRDAGRVAIDGTKCTRCGTCARVCPADVLKMNAGEVQISGDSLFECIACGHCMMVCPEDAIAVTGRGVTPQDLFPLPASHDRATPDALETLMSSRRSVRIFSDKPVEPQHVKRIVDMAATAPMGIPPWDVGCVSVLGRREVQWLAEEVVTGYEGFLKIFKPWLLTVLRPFLGKAKYHMFAGFVRPLAQTYVRNHREGRDKVFYNAPALLIFHHSPYADAHDAGIACTYAMLAAESMGLGSTMIGGAPPILQRNKTLCRRLGIPDGNTPSVALILGYPAVNFRKGIRRRFAHVTTFSADNAAG